MATESKATKAGRADARTFANESTQAEIDGACAPGLLGADEALINALGRDGTKKLFGVDERGWQKACREYNAAWLATLRKYASK